MRLRYGEMAGVSQFVFRSKLAESSAKVLSQLDGQAVIRSTYLRGAGLQSTTWWLICLRRRSTSAHTRMAFGLRLPFRLTPPPPRELPVTLRRSATTSMESKAPISLSRLSFRLEEEARPVRRRTTSTGRAALGKTTSQP